MIDIFNKKRIADLEEKVTNLEEKIQKLKRIINHGKDEPIFHLEKRFEPGYYNMYRVEGYDKDYDVYVIYWKGNDLEKAKDIATVLDKIAEKDELIRYTNDMSKEPIDWVQVTDENDVMVFLPRQ